MVLFSFANISQSMNDQQFKFDLLAFLGFTKRSNDSDLALGAQRIQKFEKVERLSPNFIYTIVIKNVSNGSAFFSYFCESILIRA